MTAASESKQRWLHDETPGIYIRRARIGWNARVMFDFAGTVTVWRLTRKHVVAWAEHVVEVEH